ncbi:MAG TPA: bifunctional phosphoribosylaminoimidazolecarboxamide formyltransferase/IMP cyclohydrolase [Candidatus Paceibacterota bacterium]
MSTFAAILRSLATGLARIAGRIDPSKGWPKRLVFPMIAGQALRYGENPHQKAALYMNSLDARAGIASARKMQGKELSYNNINDADAALECVAEFKGPAAVIVKHMNPCGVALGEDIFHAYTKAYQCDPLSAFGGIVALNRTLDRATAEEIAKIFVEVVIAPSAEGEALTVLAAKPNVRVLLLDCMPEPRAQALVVKSVAGGFVVSTRDDRVFDGELSHVSKREPAGGELADMRFAFTVAKHVKSNAIVFAKDSQTIGIGAGQMSRIYAAKIAAEKAKDAGLSLRGSVMASDAFMPFPDCVEEARKHGAVAIIQPGGSLKDQDSIDAANAAGMAMVFTGIRHFRH